MGVCMKIILFRLCLLFFLVNSFAIFSAGNHNPLAGRGPKRYGKEPQHIKASPSPEEEKRRKHEEEERSKALKEEEKKIEAALQRNKKNTHIVTSVASPPDEDENSDDSDSNFNRSRWLCYCSKRTKRKEDISRIG